MKILVLCTGNSFRSQMAQGFLESFDTRLIVCSAGTQASGKLNEKAVTVMKEVGTDISNHTSDSVVKYLDEEWDYVITVCSDANEACPVFQGKVKYILHIDFDDPSHLIGTVDYILNEFRRVRDEIRERLYRFYTDQIIPQLGPDDFCCHMFELYTMLPPSPFHKKRKLSGDLKKSKKRQT